MGWGQTARVWGAGGGYPKKNIQEQATKSKDQQKQIHKCFRCWDYQSEYETTMLAMFKKLKYPQGTGDWKSEMSYLKVF